MTASRAEKRISRYEELRAALPSQLPAYLMRQRWFGGKARRISAATVVDLIPIQIEQLDVFFLLAHVEYETGPAETYVLPMIAMAEPAGEVNRDEVHLIVRHDDLGGDTILVDALKNDALLLWLVDAIEGELVVRGIHGEIRASHSDVFREMRSPSAGVLQPKLLKGEQSNSSIAYGQSVILKVFRRLVEGINPDIEIGRFLTEKAHFPHVPPLAGAIAYRTESGSSMALGILQGFVPNQGEAWRYTLESIGGFWSEASKYGEAPPQASTSEPSILEFDRDSPALARAWIGSYLEMIDLLGKRTAQLHLALASDSSDPAFAPEPYTPSFQRDFERSALELTELNLGLLRDKLNDLPDNSRCQGNEVLRRKDEILRRFQPPNSAAGWGMRIRIHGDFHLGQVLYTGSDFVIIDFEGEPARPLAERRTKRPPLQDAAGMVRSFHYAAFAQLLTAEAGVGLPIRDAEKATSWAETWFSWVASRFLKSYFENASGGSFLPPKREDAIALLQILLLEKAVYELGYELNNRPAWVGIPLAGILQLLAQQHSSENNH